MKIINRIITFSVKHNFPRLTAFVFFLFTRRKTKKISGKKVLYLSKPIFNQDVEALIEFGKNLDYISFPRLLLLYICNYIKRIYKVLHCLKLKYLGS